MEEKPSAEAVWGEAPWTTACTFAKRRFSLETESFTREYRQSEAPITTTTTTAS